MDGREANIIFIISKATGKIVWKLGPDYDNSPEAKAIGWIIGQHHCHMVPREPGQGPGSSRGGGNREEIVEKRRT